jgi:hypothetical protein
MLMEELSPTEIKNLLKLSYDKRLVSYKNFKLDPTLSGQRVKVYYNDKLGKAIVVHRGTQGVQDMVTDAKSALGFDESNRIKYAEEIQNKAQKKYGADNIISLGHSLGAHINSVVSPDNQTQINLNRPVMPATINKKKGKKQVDIYHQYDLVSLLKSYENKNGKEVVIKNDSSPLNILQNHATDVLNTLEPKVAMPLPHKGAIGLPKPVEIAPETPMAGAGLLPLKKARTQNTWIAHIKKYQEEHKCSYKEAMGKAKSTYKGG